MKNKWISYKVKKINKNFNNKLNFKFKRNNK